MIRWAAALLVFSVTLLASADDSCDIAVAPAATLLLPYFEVDTTAGGGNGANTLFTVTNTSRYPQIAAVTIWTDWAYPVVTFDLFLTGYDVQGVSLYDVVVLGRLPRTPFQSTRFSNPNFHADAASTCSGLADSLPADLARAVRSALTMGVGYSVAGSAECKGPIGGNHPDRAIGYATIDVVSHCTAMNPAAANGAYFAGPASPLLFDNTLLGDYQQIGLVPGGTGAAPGPVAQANTMVHIRATPEGGLSGASGGVPVATNLPFTFYDRYTPAGARAADRRQPLPSAWAARYLQGGPTVYATDYKIWREAVTTGLPSCTNVGSVQSNSVLPMTSVVRFDEHENAVIYQPSLICCYPSNPTLPAASRAPTTSFIWPPHVFTDAGGWMSMNLSHGSRYVTIGGSYCVQALSAQREGFGSPCAAAPPGSSGSRATSQNWVVVSMYGVSGSRRLSADFDAAALANGCTPAALTGLPVGAPLVCPDGQPFWNCGAGTVPPSVNP